MSNIVLIEANGNVKQIKAKDILRETLYKKAGFRSNDNFDKAYTWSIEYNSELINIELWAKTDGKANNENKYDFPPPVDNELYFGTCVLIRADDNGQIINLTSDVWLKVYEQLFGGFENIAEDGDDEDEEEEEDEDTDAGDDALPNIKKTKHGYIKDNFVVDDEEEEEEQEEQEDDCLDSCPVKKTNKQSQIQSQIPSKIQSQIQSIIVNESEEEEYYGSELEEEAYSYSDED